MQNRLEVRCWGCPPGRAAAGCGPGSRELVAVLMVVALNWADLPRAARGQHSRPLANLKRLEAVAMYSLRVRLPWARREPSKEFGPEAPSR